MKFQMMTEEIGKEKIRNILNQKHKPRIIIRVKLHENSDLL